MQSNNGEKLSTPRQAAKLPPNFNKNDSLDKSVERELLEILDANKEPVHIGDIILVVHKKMSGGFWGRLVWDRGLVCVEILRDSISNRTVGQLYPFYNNIIKRGYSFVVKNGF